MTRVATLPAALSPSAAVENHPPEFSGETALRAPAARKYADAAHWNNLAALHLARYDLPGWDVPYSASAAETWLDRLGLSRAAWLAVGNYRAPGNFVALNPGWPLRAAIGLMLELRAERSGGAR